MDIARESIPEFMPIKNRGPDTPKHASELANLENRFRAGQAHIDNSRAAATQVNHKVFTNNVSLPFHYSL